MLCIFMTGCALQLPQAPKDTTAVFVDLANKTTYEFKVPQDPQSTGDWTYLGEKPIEALDKQYCFDAKEIQDYISWKNQLKSWGIKHCK